MLWPRYCGRKPNSTTRPCPTLTCTSAARPATRSGCNAHPDKSTFSGSVGYRPTTRTALESSTSNAGPPSYQAMLWAGMPRAMGSLGSSSSRKIDPGREADVERVVGRDGDHAHQERQRMGGDVVRRERRAAGIEPQVGIALRFEQRLRECGIRLPQHHDVAPGGKPLPAECDGVQRGADLYLAAVQNAEQGHEPDRVLMLAGNDVRVGPAAPAAHGSCPDREKVGEPSVPVARRVLEQGVGSVGLVAHDVAQRPASARPGMAEIPAALPRIEAARASGQLLEGHLDG